MLEPHDLLLLPRQSTQLYENDHRWFLSVGFKTNDCSVNHGSARMLRNWGFCILFRILGGCSWQTNFPKTWCAGWCQPELDIFVHIKYDSRQCIGVILHQFYFKMICVAISPLLCVLPEQFTKEKVIINP